MTRSAWCLTALLAGCSAGDDIRFSATCSPAVDHDRVTCTVQNLGNAASRACLTVKLDVPERRPIVARRVCTGVLAPQQTVTVAPPFVDKLTPCLNDNRWWCKIEILENSRTMGENLPPAR